MCEDRAAREKASRLLSQRQADRVYTSTLGRTYRIRQLSQSPGPSQEGLYLVCFADVARTFVPTAAGACQSCSSYVRHGVHDDAAVRQVLLKQPEQPTWTLTAL